MAADAAKKGAPGPKRARRSPEERRILNARMLGLVFCAAGFAVIAIGWAAMSRVTCVDCQMPYLLSAGATGVALAVLGVGLLLLAEIRAARHHLVALLRRPGAAAPTVAPPGSASKPAASNG